MVSILMPVYNTESYLAETLDSIIKQSHEDWELICVNDFSTDDSLKILEKYCTQDSRIQVINNDHKGIIHALRKAYKNSSGKYITRMDADDIMSHNKIEHLYQILNAHGVGHIATGKVKYFSSIAIGNGYYKYQQWLNNLCEDNNHFTEIYKECVIPSPCWMVHKEDLERCGKFDDDVYPEDYDLCFRFYKNNLKPVASKEILHHWRDYPDRTSRTSSDYADNRFLHIKVKYFLELDYDFSKRLVLLGAGKKGKSVAKLLLSNDVKFVWITNNLKKIDKEIYGVKLIDQALLNEFPDSNIIVLVANPAEQNQIRSRLLSVKQSRVFYFC